MHYQVSVGKLRVNFLDASHRQDFTGWLLGELVRTVAGTDRDGKGVDVSLFDEPLRFIGIGQKLVVSQFTNGTVAIFLFAFAAFERPEATQFAFDADATGVGSLRPLRQVTRTL